MVSNDTYKKRRERAIQALLQSPTIKEAANLSGISETTLKRYLSDSKFKEHYRAARKQIMDSTIGQLQAASSIAIRELIRMMESEKTKDYVKVQACRTVLEMALKATEVDELQELEQRMTEIEEMGSAS